MEKKNSIYTVTVDNTDKLVFPPRDDFVNANKLNNIGDNFIVMDDGNTTKVDGFTTIIRGGDSLKLEGPDNGIDVTTALNTNGIHEQNVYANILPNYSMRGWYLASQFSLVNPDTSSAEILDDVAFEQIGEREIQVLISDKQLKYDDIKDINIYYQPDSEAIDRTSEILSKLVPGDILTFKNDWNLINAIEVTGAEGNILKFKYKTENLNKNQLDCMKHLQPYEDHILSASVRCFAKPNAGFVEFAGKSATAVGGSANISRGYLSTNIGGRRNNTCGDFSVSIGEDNIVEGKSSVALGSQNKILQENNISIGNKNEMTANVRQGFIFGGSNKTSQENSVLVGRGLTLDRKNNSLTRTIIGRFNDPAEDGAVVIGVGQGTEDLYNGAIIDRTSCTFRGKQTFEYYNSGDAFTAEHQIILLGTNNKANNTGAYLFGAGLRRENSSGSQVIVGRFNEEKQNAIFVIGNGTVDTDGNPIRKNAMEVYGDYIDIKTKVYFQNSIAGALNCSGTKMTFGNGNTSLDSLAEKTFLFGAGLEGQTTANWYQVVTGSFNKQDDDAVFIIGNGQNGTSGGRHNAMTVYKQNSAGDSYEIKFSNAVKVNGYLYADSLSADAVAASSLYLGSFEITDTYINNLESRLEALEAMHTFTTKE